MMRPLDNYQDLMAQNVNNLLLTLFVIYFQSVQPLRGRTVPPASLDYPHAAAVAAIT